jgi:hypothetical protein
MKDIVFGGIHVHPGGVISGGGFIAGSEFLRIAGSFLIKAKTPLSDDS